MKLSMERRCLALPQGSGIQKEGPRDEGAISRRKMLGRMAAGTAVAWTAPVLVSTAYAQTPGSPVPGPTCTCNSRGTGLIFNGQLSGMSGQPCMGANFPGSSMSVTATASCGNASSTPNCEGDASVSGLLVRDLATGDTLSANSVSAGVTVMTTGSTGLPGSITCSTNGSGASTSGLVYTHTAAAP